MPTKADQFETERKTRRLKLLEEVKRGVMDRAAWEQRVKQLMLEGHLRRAHLLRIVSIEVLRGVGFGARELHEGGLALPQLRALQPADAQTRLVTADASDFREGQSIPPVTFNYGD